MRQRANVGDKVCWTQRRRRAIGWCVGLLLFVVGCRGTDPPENPGADTAGGPGDVRVDGSEVGCRSNCRQAGARSCSGNAEVVECREVRPGCLELRRVEDCEDRCGGAGSCSMVCREGACVDEDPGPECTSKCEAGKRRCNAQGKVVRCEDFDADGCTEWGGTFACDPGTFCADENGQCVQPDCPSPCSVNVDKKCEGDLIRKCTIDERNCTVYGPAQTCGEGEVCSDEGGGARCVEQMTCQDECSGAVCRSNAGIRRCEDVDGDGCRELAATTKCPDGEQCQNGGCVSAETCKDQCPMGEKICVGNRIASCQDHDGDGCLEFNQPRACSGGATCKRDGNTATCAQPRQTGKVVINEIFYDPMGSDQRGSAPNAHSPSFVELSGPAGFKLDGYTLRMVNGANGRTYQAVTLPAGAKLDGGGYAVVTMKKPGAFLENEAPTMTNVYRLLTPYQSGADGLQNGPDNVVLVEPSGATADAVGHGFFPSMNKHFRGEGQPALPTLAGRSLGRGKDSADTDDNLYDFQSYYPTPGLENSDLLINEIYVDQPGHDDATETFVEIAAPIPGWENLKLDGYILHAVNGHDGKDYIPRNGRGVKLFGHKLNDGNSAAGYFVICNAKAGGLTCNTQYTGVDFQNGPDNFVLSYYGRTVDAVGYGDFSGGATFKGEDTPVPYGSSSAGEALGRWPLPNVFFDFDTNLIDFFEVVPTPGAKNRTP